MRIAIATGLVEQLLARAAETPGREVCGLLFGSAAHVAAAVPAINVAADPATAFEIDPATLFAAHRGARAGGPVAVGCYHSHPNGRATPSPTDAAAAVPGQLWLIVAGGEARLFRAEMDGGFRACTMTST